MTLAAKTILESFEALPEPDKEAVVVEILRRATAAPYPTMEDEDLIFAADQVFLELDRREGVD